VFDRSQAQEERQLLFNWSITKALRTFSIAHPVDPKRVGDWQVRKLTAFRIIFMGIGVSQSPYYSPHDFWFTVIKCIQPGLMVWQIIAGLYMIVSGLIFYRCNLVKYVFHFHMSTLLLSAPCILAFHFAGMLFIPNLFKGFKEVITSLLTVLFIYFLVQQAKRVYCELVDKDEAESPAATSFHRRLRQLTMVASAVPAFSAVLISRITGHDVRGEMWSFLTPLFFLLSFAIGLALMRMYVQDFFYSYYLLRYSEAFRLWQGVVPEIWYGKHYPSSRWVMEQLQHSDAVEEKLLSICETDPNVLKKK